MYEDDVVKKRMYQIWNAMIQRCHNPKVGSYERYGAKGIIVSEEWQDFEVFYADMKESHKEGLSIDRVDNSKGYSKENCKWSTRHEQSINKGIFKNNSSGYKGIYQTDAGNWAARITVNLIVINLGIYQDIEEAYKGRQEAEKHYFGYVLGEGISQELLDKKANGWKSVAEQHRDGEIELIGFVPSNSPRRAKPKNFGYGSPSVYSKVMAKQIRRVNYINDKLQTGKWLLDEEVKQELEQLKKLLEEAKVQFGIKEKPAITYEDGYERPKMIIASHEYKIDRVQFWVLVFCIVLVITAFIF